MIVAGQVVLGGTVDSEAVAAEIALHLSKLMRPDAVFDDRVGAGEPLEQALDRQVDQYRDLLREGSAQTALKLFRKLLDTLPAGASPKIRFRVKANVGHCYIQIGNFVEAERWLLEAYELAPTEKNAIANKALAFILTDRFADAFEVCRAALQSDPTNEQAASYLLQAAVQLSDIPNPIELIPADLLQKEGVALARVSFLRAREQGRDWWTFAREAATSFPANKMISLLAYESYIDEAIQSPDFQRERKVSSELRGSLLAAASALEGHWILLRSSEVPTRPDAIAALTGAMLANQVLGNIKGAVDLTREVVDRTTDEASLTNVFQIAYYADEGELAERAVDAIEAPSASIKFFRALLYLARNKWKEAADCLAEAAVPDTEASGHHALSEVRGGGMDQKTKRARRAGAHASADKG